MPGRLENKIAIITGSSSGIGRATALAFASHGATVIVSDLREQARVAGSSGDADSSQPSTVSAIEEAGGKAIFVKCDTTQANEVEALVQTAVEKYGRLDIMVNNAGIAVESGGAHGPRPVWEYEESALSQTLDVNVKGVFLGIKYASAAMKEHPRSPTAIEAASSTSPPSSGSTAAPAPSATSPASTPSWASLRLPRGTVRPTGCM